MKWESPYQLFEFHCALLAGGFDAVEISTTAGKLYLSNWYADELTGWELGFAWREPPGIPALLYVFEKIHQEVPVEWSGNSYYTIVIDLKESYQAYFSKNCQRNLKKAIHGNLSLELVDVDHFYVDDLLVHVLSRGGHPGMDSDQFKSVIFRCVQSNICDMFMVKDMFENIIAGAIVLKSSSVANLRFTYYLPDYQNLRPMNFLISKVADFYRETGHSYLDLSGFYTGEPNSTMSNINRFKREFGNKVVEFKIVRNSL